MSIGNPKQIPLFSTHYQGWELASRGYAHERISYRKKQQRKIVFHTLLHPRFAKKWFQLLHSSEHHYILSSRPRIYIKPFRVYLSTRWNPKRKQKVILDSYRFLETKGDLFQQFLSHPQGITVARFTIDTATECVLKLEYDDRFRKEGEFVLTLESEQLGGKIVSVSFAVEENSKGHWYCYIGCVQGHPDPQAWEHFKFIQKAMFGLRPNSFVVNVLQDLIRQLGCETIYCTGDSIQANRKKHAIHLPGIHDISFNYNKFWLEMEAEDVGSGWFRLPLIPARKEMSEIKSQKRSMYRKRYALLDGISQKISETVQSFTSNT
ncbi:MAG: DUF535 family protein [Bacteroidales bacterium]|nr:DUF535 family protein [Bacteroidales bacterium]